MEARSIIGVVIVGVVGIGLAATAVIMLGPQTAPTPSLDVDGVEDRSASPGDDGEPVRVSLDGAPPPGSRRGTAASDADGDDDRDSRSRPDLAKPARPAHDPIPAEDARALGELQARVEAFRHDPAMLELEPGTSPTEMTEQLDGILGEVETLASEFKAIAAETDSPEAAGEAYQQAAMLYEQLAERVPPLHPSASADSHQAWEERRMQIVEGLRREADAYRQDAELAAEDARR